ncbi:hypothetical protein GF068_04570 [Polyangium spumosum]|uniref:Uncharacterized protein n=1 Tax=Polyangium spumosum TaxID=889282 RepID=A0A6N7PHC8_9BACT|nr:hypothetical protein [Polyangium spumosum]
MSGALVVNDIASGSHISPARQKSPATSTTWPAAGVGSIRTTNPASPASASSATGTNAAGAPSTVTVTASSEM